MLKSMEKTDNIICPECKGNGFVRVPYQLAREESWANCEECEAEGTIPGHKWDTYGRIRKN